jgi:hypothetical protein
VPGVDLLDMPVDLAKCTDSFKIFLRRLDDEHHQTNPKSVDPMAVNASGIPSRAS